MAKVIRNKPEQHETLEMSAEQLAGLLAQESDDTTPASPQHSITVGVHAKKSGQLGGIAYDIAEFIAVLREQTGETFALDIQAAVGEAPESSGDKAPVVGFIAQEQAEDDEGDDE
ncbi:hypothetical protein [Paenibacillus sp. YN15]|uniref:hypothetical protein n=1 Tax=Paenibacillus sp. YN15 TaxID=1742774 RepID=UPI000DCC535C|nr:hypothetical protein [Paenibacillus sp. YN15]RAU96803.1 hypothetical protein DQG13_19800 [Paenibacillus sp. YN15]